ncbi:hypothetical protein R1sor_009702 [Riccia sorocarpa]|uniref:TF-B3 domain-containing protein n=1 Tax=Riccia sorocarpa TaxID=122646 RepID=A0ABD3HXD0_9MARC
MAEHDRSRSHQSSRLASKRARIEAHNVGWVFWFNTVSLVADRSCSHDYPSGGQREFEFGDGDVNSRDGLVAKFSRMHSGTVSWPSAAPGCMSGTLNDVLMFRNRISNQQLLTTTTGDLRDMSNEKDVVAAAADRDMNSIEWQFLRDHQDHNNNDSSTAGRPAKLMSSSSDLEFRLPFGNTTTTTNQKQQQQQIMGPTAGAQWDSSPRNNSPVDCRVAVNYLGSFGPRPLNSSTCTVDSVGGAIRSTLDGNQLVSTLSCSREEVADRGESDEFGRESPVLSSLILGQGGGGGGSQTSAAQLFGCGLMAQAPTKAGGGQQQQQQQQQQQVNNVHKAAPHFRNLFPEQSSSLSSVLTQESTLSGNDVSEHVHPHKKQRRFDFIDLPGAATTNSALSQGESLQLSENHHSRNSSPYPSGGAVSSLANFIETQQKANPAASFSPSLQQQKQNDRPAFSSSNVNSTSPLQNLTLSTFHQVSSSAQQLPLKFSSNDTSPVRISGSIDYRHASSYPSAVDTKLQSLRTSCVPGFLISQTGGPGGFKPLNLIDGLTNCNNQTPNTNNVGRDYLQSAAAMSQLCSIRRPGIETGAAAAAASSGRAAWPAGFINFPSAGALEGGLVPSPMSTSRRVLLDHFRNEFVGDEGEVHRIRPISESQIRLVIQKQLTTTDVGSLGRIILPKKEAETHLPHLPDKEGIEMCLNDYDVDRTWIMKYRFWPNNKSRMYLLENTGEFAKYHGLQQGDLLLIYRQLPARYVLRVKKMAPPLHLVTPPRSINTEAGGATAAEDLVSAAAAAAGTDTVPSSRALSSSASSRNLSSTSGRAAESNLKEACGRDVPALSYVEAAVSSHHHRAQLLGLDGQSANLIESLKKHLHTTTTTSTHHHQGKTSSFTHHNFMTVQTQQQHQHHQSTTCNTTAAAEAKSENDPTELDGECVYNLEEFPRLIEAAEISDIFPLDSDSSETQLSSPVDSFQFLRKSTYQSYFQKAPDLLTSASS